MEHPIAPCVDYTRVGGAKPMGKIDFGRNAGHRTKNQSDREGYGDLATDGALQAPQARL